MKTLIIFIIFTTIHTGYSLNCWKCNGCETSKWYKETCKTVDTQYQEVGCITQVIDDLSSRTRITLRKCDIHDKNQPYKCQELPDSQQISCEICKGDFCNAASNFQIILNYSGSLIILIWLHHILT